MSVRWILVALTLVLGLDGFVEARQTSDATRQTSDATPAAWVEAKVDAVVKAALDTPLSAGLSVGVAQHGKVILAKGYGLAEAEHQVPANAETLFRIGSVTKQFTSAAILKLIAAKKIALDDPLTKYVDYPMSGHTVTVRQLLNHTSGIPSYTDIGQAWVEKWPLELSDEELLGLVKDRPFDFIPGEKWAYNNTGYYLLGMIIEKVTGQSYAEHLQQALFKPLAMNRTQYDSNRTLIRNRAQGYGVDNGQLANDHLLGMRQPGGAGGLISTGGELVQWSLALSSGQVVPTETYHEMTRSTSLADGTVKQYGYGIGTDTFEGRNRVQHGGGIMGFNSMLFWLPEAGLHVAVISNSEAIRSGRIADDIARAVLGIEKAKIKDESIPAELRDALVGKYTVLAVGLVATIAQVGDTLTLQATGQQASRLMWQGDPGREFHLSVDPDIRVVFAADGKSFDLYQAGQKFAATRNP